ncbi:MAG: 6,7-dimethyl-8-ribityllumazine synthase [Gammaproteobacteria bacterium]|nr:6,7-dimethyl-8-ribityllumazine synthase [Gammaproteobacteria bacterium]
MTLKNQDLHIGIVVAEFNTLFTSKLQEGCHAHLIAQGVPAAQIRIIKVPGAIEIPFVIQGLARQKKYHALIALGAVIRGETSHYDYVCEQVSQGCQRIMLDHQIPVIFGVLTTENDEQAFARTGGEHSHNGVEAAKSALRMIEVASSL